MTDLRCGRRAVLPGAALGMALLGLAPLARAAVDETTPDWHSPKAVMAWAMELDRKGWDYLGSVDDSIYFTRRADPLPDGHLTFALRAEFFDHRQVGQVSSSLTEFEVDCQAFRMRRLSTRILSRHNLKGDTLKFDDRPTDWFEPPGGLIPAALTGACLSL